MRDTRETYYADGSGKTKRNTKPRFNVGDEVSFMMNGDLYTDTVNSCYWDTEFGGWLVAVGLIGIHEQNFISPNEEKAWKHHDNMLWSWWTKKETE